MHEYIWGNHDAINGSFIVVSRFASIAKPPPFRFRIFRDITLGDIAFSFFSFFFGIGCQRRVKSWSTYRDRTSDNYSAARVRPVMYGLHSVAPVIAGGFCDRCTQANLLLIGFFSRTPAIRSHSIFHFARATNSQTKSRLAKALRNGHGVSPASHPHSHCFFSFPFIYFFFSRRKKLVAFSFSRQKKGASEKGVRLHGESYLNRGVQSQLESR